MANDFSELGVPIGFGMALARNIEAMKYFANLTFEQQKAVIDNAHNIDSKAEMTKYVADISKNYPV